MDIPFPGKKALNRHRSAVGREVFWRWTVPVFRAFRQELCSKRVCLQVFALPLKQGFGSRSALSAVCLLLLHRFVNRMHLGWRDGTGR